MQLTVTRRWAETEPARSWSLSILDYTAYVVFDGAVYRWAAFRRGERLGFGNKNTERAAKAVAELTIGQHFDKGGDA